MKPTKLAYTTLFCFLCAAFAYARPLTQDEPKPQRPDVQQPEPKPETQVPEKKETAPKVDKNNQENKVDQDQEKQEKDQQKNEKDQQKEEKKAQKEEQKNGQSPAPTSNGQMNGGQPAGAPNERAGAGAHPAGKSGHIPDDKFHASFGKGHTFAIGQPVVVNNQTTFQYGGYSFILVDAWPAGWAYTDNCYIDYIDGEYFLFDLLHPGVRIALFVSM